MVDDRIAQLLGAPEDPAHLAARTSETRVRSGTVTANDAGILEVATVDGPPVHIPVSELPPSVTPTPGMRVTFAQDPDGKASAAGPDLVAALYEAVVPEIRDGAVRIMRIARVAGSRTKVAVAATQAGVDPVNTCVGPGVNRLRAVADHLGGDRIDVVAWHPDRDTFLTNAMAPAAARDVQENDGELFVRVPSHQMSAAVGEGGLNSFLAGELVGAKVTVVRET